MCGAAAAASVLPPIIAAVSGLLGALIGGGATILANHLTSKAAAARSRQESQDRVKHERNERLLAKGEEVVSLLSSAGEWHTQVIDAALTPGHSNMLVYPEAPCRVEALVLAYFPGVDRKTLHALKVVNVSVNGSVLEMLTTKAAPAGYQALYEGLLSSAVALQRAVLKEMESLAG
jgi:hypothetical protein